MVKLNTLENTKKLYPHFFDKNEYSNFSKHLSIINNQQNDIRHKLKSIEWARYIEKPLQIWKTQSEPYKYTINFKSLIPSMKEINIYKNPIFSKKNEVVSYDDLIVHQVIENDNFNHYEYSHEDETDIYYKHYDLVFEDVCKIGHLSQEYEQLTRSQISYNTHMSIEVMGGTTTLTENGKVFEAELVDEGTDDEENSGIDSYLLCLMPITNAKMDKGSVFEFEVTDYTRGVSVKFGTENFEVGSFHIVSDDGDKYRCEVDENTSNIKVYKNGEFVQEIENYGEREGFKPIFYSYDRVPFNVCVKNIKIYNYDASKNKKRIIPSDTFAIEIYTHDDYRFVKGFPENDYTSKEDNILQYQYNSTFIDIDLEEISYSKYLTFRVHKDKIKQILICKNDKPIFKQIFLLDFINSKVDSKDFSYTYFDESITNENTYGKGEFTKVYEVEDVLPNNDRIYPINSNEDKYVFRLPLSIDDFNEDGYVKDTYDIEVTTYEKRYKCRTTQDKVFSKRYNGYDDVNIDCFDHDYSLDILGHMLNIHRFRFYKLQVEDANHYSKTYPRFNNKATEDDYHYMKRIQNYISNYNYVLFPVLEFWKYYHTTCEFKSRKDIIGKQDKSYILTNYDDKCTENAVISYDEETGEEIITEYSINKATSLKGTSNQIVIDETVWFESILVNNLFIVPSAKYRLRYGIANNEDNVNIRLICYNRQGRKIRTTNIIPDLIEEQDPNYKITENYEYVDTLLEIPSDTVSIQIILESDSSFDFADVTFERQTVSSFGNSYMATDENYNSNVYDVIVDYNTIPLNIKFGGTERFNVLLNRTLPLTKKAYLSVNLKEESKTRLKAETSFKVFLLNYFDSEVVYENITQFEEDITHFIEPFANYNIQFTSIRDEHEEFTDDFLITTTIVFYDENDVELESYEFEDNIDSDVPTTVKYSVMGVDGSKTAKLLIESDTEFTLSNIIFNIDGEVKESLL